jgi:hypothetical protein
MIKNNIFHLTFTLVAALSLALMSSPVAVSAYTYTSTSDYDRGYSQGQQTAQNIWKNKDGSNCKYISKLLDQVHDYIHTHFWWQYGDSDSTKSFDTGAQAGMTQVLQQYQTQCHDHDNHHDDNDNVDVDTGMCSGMGKNAASEIAEKYAETYCGVGSRLSIISQKKYKKECLSIGKDDCKGAINDEIFIYCGRYLNDYDVLKGLKGQCLSKVKDSIDYSLD